jgi:hypothetical protein
MGTDGPGLDGMSLGTCSSIQGSGSGKSRPDLRYFSTETGGESGIPEYGIARSILIHRIPPPRTIHRNIIEEPGFATLK